MNQPTIVYLIRHKETREWYNLLGVFEPNIRNAQVYPSDKVEGLPDFAEMVAFAEVPF